MAVAVALWLWLWRNNVVQSYAEAEEMRYLFVDYTKLACKISMPQLDVFSSFLDVSGVSVSIESPSKYAGCFLHLGKLETQTCDFCGLR